jgi:hypothetical protein
LLAVGGLCFVKKRTPVESTRHHRL